MFKKIDDLDDQKEWVDWISKYGDNISKQFEKPISKLLEGIIYYISFGANKPLIVFSNSLV